MNRPDAQKLAAELVRAAIAAGWNSNMPSGEDLADEVVQAINTIADGLIEYSNR